ncbi:MAG: UTP--glucose-1-phosphate uridylyltransferase, partial [Planctomycetota bacterium]
MTATFDDLRPKLQAIGQDHVLAHVDDLDDLDDASRQKLHDQLAALDLDEIAALAESHVKQKPEAHLPSDLAPPEVLPRLPDAARVDLYDQARQKGEKLLADGKVAAFLVAGGQGTRLGYDGPKGEFPVTPVKDKPLFQVFAEQIKATGDRYGKPVPWYVMTSEVNDARTREFFEKHAYFGLDKANVTFFVQGMMPAFGTDGKLLLAEKDSLALSADGHGGSLKALAKTGALADMRQRGIEHLSYFQVDNPLVRVLDPLFLGLHAHFESEMSSKSLPKA